MPVLPWSVGPDCAGDREGGPSLLSSSVVPRWLLENRQKWILYLPSSPSPMPLLALLSENKLRGTLSQGVKYFGEMAKEGSFIDTNEVYFSESRSLAHWHHPENRQVNADSTVLPQVKAGI